MRMIPATLPTRNALHTATTGAVCQRQGDTTLPDEHARPASLRFHAAKVRTRPRFASPPRRASGTAGRAQGGLTQRTRGHSRIRRVSDPARRQEGCLVAQPSTPGPATAAALPARARRRCPFRHPRWLRPDQPVLVWLWRTDRVC